MKSLLPSPDTVRLSSPVRPGHPARMPFLSRAALIMRKTPFVVMHLAMIAVFFVPLTWTSGIVGFGLVVLRMFGITAGFHRYFAHRAYKTSRVMQFVLAWIGCMSLQKGPLWWAAGHRHHHKHSDEEEDLHSPVKHGLWWSHVGWVVSSKHDGLDMEKIKDFSKYPELVVLDRFHWVPGLLLAIGCYAMDGMSGLVWAFLVSTVVLYHMTFLVNSACHLYGSRRYKTEDASRNNWWVAILTLGEGWHNNHHHYMSSANQGFFWWEIDISYYILRTMSAFGLVWDLRKPPAEKLAQTIVRPE